MKLILNNKNIYPLFWLKYKHLNVNVTCTFKIKKKLNETDIVMNIWNQFQQFLSRRNFRNAKISCYL